MYVQYSLEINLELRKIRSPSNTETEHCLCPNAWGLGLRLPGASGQENMLSLCAGGMFIVLVVKC